MTLGETLLVALIFAAFFFWLGTRNVAAAAKQVREEQAPEVVYVEPEVLPYWTVYGQPTYWPQFWSPYWSFGGPSYSPWGYGGLDKGLYGPHGPHPGYSGRAGGGFGGGGGGHGGGGGGGGHH